MIKPNTKHVASGKALDAMGRNLGVSRIEKRILLFWKSRESDEDYRARLLVAFKRGWST
jgi:hypothetical protein